MSFPDALQTKEKIVSFIKIRGPSLPVHIAKETGLSILFASAFLSELISEKRLKISSMKVGSSPLYFIPGQEKMLENFSNSLKSKEKDAFLLLKEKKFLKDIEQEPAIRVALRAIKDFAIPLKRNEEIYWKYLTAIDGEIKAKIAETEKPVELRKLVIMPAQKQEEAKKEIQEEIPKEVQEEIKKQEKKEIKKKKGAERIKKKKKVAKKKDDKFFHRIKEFLSNKSLEILDIESFNKNELSLRVKEGDKEILIVAFNKKRLTEMDIINAYKKASAKGLKYRILVLGEPIKKIENLMDALKELENIEKIE